MATSNKSIRSQSFVRASIALIILLPADLLFTAYWVISGLKYMSGREPPWYGAVTSAIVLIDMYIVPPALFVGAGYYVGSRAPKNAVKDAVMFGLMWTAVIFLALQILYGVLILGRVIALGSAFIESWTSSLLATFVAGIFISALCAIGGAISKVKSLKQR